MGHRRAVPWHSVQCTPGKYTRNRRSVVHSFLLDGWALITASATLCPSGLPHGSPRRTEGRWRYLDTFEDRRTHRPGFLTEKPLRRGRSVRAREEKVVHRCQACPVSGMVEVL